MKAFASAPVEAAFADFPHGQRKRLLTLRELILRTAAQTAGVGELEETLKWGEPAYLTTATKSGSTIRLGVARGGTSRATMAMYFNCNTTLVDTFRTIFPDLRYEGNRAILIDEQDQVPMRELERCIEMALTYHQAKQHQAKQHQAKQHQAKHGQSKQRRPTQTGGSKKKASAKSQ